MCAWRAGGQQHLQLVEQTLGLREMLVGHVEDARGNELARQQQQEEEAACRAGRPSQYKSLSIIVDQAIRRGRVSGTPPWARTMSVQQSAPTSG